MRTLKTQAFAAVPLFGHREIKHTLGQAPKTECGCPNGRRLENRHVRSPFPEKLACYFCKLRFVAQEDVYPTCVPKMLQIVEPSLYNNSLIDICLQC